MSILIYGALILWPIAYRLRRKWWPSKTSSRQARRVQAGNRALKGLLPGALVGTLLFPMPIEVLGLLHYQISRPQPISQETAVADLFFLLLLSHFALVVWSTGILFLVPLWSLVNGDFNAGPLAASILGALATTTVAFCYWQTIRYALFMLAMNDALSEPHLKQVCVAWMGFAGAASGATVWWAGYRPDTVKKRLAMCPFLCVSS